MPEILNVSSQCPRISGSLPNFPVPEHVDIDEISTVELTFACGALPGCSKVFELISTYPLDGAAAVNKVEGICPLQTTISN